MNPPFTVGQFEFILRGVETVRGPNYMSDTAEVSVLRGGQEMVRVYPEKRNYPVQQMPHNRSGN